jgi:hypothetical protein
MGIYTYQKRTKGESGCTLEEWNGGLLGEDGKKGGRLLEGEGGAAAKGRGRGADARGRGRGAARVWRGEGPPMPLMRNQRLTTRSPIRAPGPIE